jgi:hypothetical protein
MGKTKHEAKRTPGKGKTPVVAVALGQDEAALPKSARAAQGRPQQGAPVAATEGGKVAGGGADVGGVTAASERRAEIDELPSMAKITGLKAVEQGIALSFVPLRSGPAAGVHATEKTSLADGAKKSMKMHGMIDGAIDDINLGEGLVDYVPDGCVDIRLRSARSFKANHLGI